ncbi:MAG: hypothetical protein FWD74_09155, partial [Actinomycetia bacterium]|nr:hypothetical protein [Actinomycetes bacterium]
RRLKFVRPAADPLEVDQPVESIEAGYAQRDEMRTRLAALPRKQRAAVVLRYYLGLSDAEIAGYLGCREGSVRTYVSRALRALRIAASGSAPAACPGRRQRRDRTDPDPTAAPTAELFTTPEPVTEYLR